MRALCILVSFCLRDVYSERIVELRNGPSGIFSGGFLIKFVEIMDNVIFFYRIIIICLRVQWTLFSSN